MSQHSHVKYFSEKVARLCGLRCFFKKAILNIRNLKLSFRQTTEKVSGPSV